MRTYEVLSSTVRNPAPSTSRARLSGPVDGTALLMQMQRTVGNRGVSQLMASRRGVGGRSIARLVGRVPASVQRCGGDTTCGCEETAAPMVSRLAEGAGERVIQRQVGTDQPAPVVQRQVDPWAGPGPSTVDRPYRVVEDDVKVTPNSEMGKLLGLPPESVPPGAWDKPDFLLSVLAGTPGASASQLTEMEGVPEEVAAELPEGKVAEVDQDVLSGFPAHEIKGAVEGANEAISHTLAHSGFASAGPNAIGIVAFPQSRLVRAATGGGLKAFGTPGPFLPESKIILGHTAVYVRVNNEIHLIRSYAPQSLVDAAVNFGKMRAGTGGVPAQIIDHLGSPAPAGGRMFDITTGQSVEYRVSKEVAEDFAKSLPEGGPLPGQLYTAQPEVAASLGTNTRLCMGRNCVHWAVEKVETAIGSKVGPGDTSVNDVGGVDRARQGKMQDFLTKKPPGVGPAKPVYGRMPTHIRVFKTGGKLYGVFSYGLSVYRIFTAPSGHEAEVLFEEVGGHAGGSWGAEAGVEGCLALAPETGGLSLLVCGIAGGIGGGKAIGWIAGKVGGAIDALINMPELISDAFVVTAEIMGELGEGFSKVAQAPWDFMLENFTRLHSQLDPGNWDTRYLPPTISADLGIVGQAAWSKIGNLDLQGLGGVAKKPIRELGIPGDAAGRLARSVSELATRQHLDDLVITPDALLDLNIFKFAETIQRWNLSFVQDPEYIAGTGGRGKNEGALLFDLAPVLRTRATINPGNWDVSKIPAANRDDGESFDLPGDIVRIGNTWWSRLSKLDEQGFREQSAKTMPEYGVSDALISNVAAGLSAEHFLQADPEQIHNLTPEQFVGYLRDFKSGLDFQTSPSIAADTAIRWVRAGFKPW